MTTPLDITDFVYNTGTLTIAPGDTTAVFSGTSLSANIKDGDYLFAGGSLAVIETVTDDTHTELFTEWAGSDVAAGTYVILKTSMLRNNAVQIGYDTAAFLAFLDNTTIWYVVEGAAPDPSVGEDGNRALKTNVTPWVVWLKTGGVWVEQAGSPGGPGATILSQTTEPDTDHPDNSLWIDSDSADLDVYVLTGSPPAWSDTGMNLKGATGPASWAPPVAWVTATAYVVGPPASVVTQGGETYVCLVDHTSGTFATDLAASKWIKVAAKGADGTGTGDVVAANNLSDLADIPTARTNLGLGSAATTAASAYATAAQGTKADSAVQTLVEGTNITIDDTDPQNPIISVTGGGGGGSVDSIVKGGNIAVDNADPANPVVSVPVIGFNVFDFGAVGDGSTDDTSAIQDALDAAQAFASLTNLSNGRVVAPPGYVFKITSGLTIDKPIDVDFRSLISYAATSGAALTFNSVKPTTYGQEQGTYKFLGFRQTSSGNSNTPTSVNTSGATAIRINSLAFSRLEIGEIQGFTYRGIWCDGTGGAYSPQVIQHNTFILGQIVNNGQGIYINSTDAATSSCQVCRWDIQNIYQNFTNIRMDDDASDSHSFYINAMDNCYASGYGIQCSGSWNIFRVGYTASPIRFETGATNNTAIVANTIATGVSFTDVDGYATSHNLMFSSGVDWASQVASYIRADSFIRERLTADRTYYVDNTNGSDSNNGLASGSGHAFKTIQKAINVVTNLDLGTFNVTIQVADGTYTGAVTVTGAWLGSGTVTITGNTTTPANCLLNVTGTAILASSGARLSTQGLKIVSTDNGIRATSGALVRLVGKMEFGANSSYALLADAYGEILAEANFTISGAGFAAFGANNFGTVNVAGRAITLSGTLGYSSSFASVSVMGLIVANSFTFTGAATGARYSALTGGGIFTFGGGANVFPGNAAGSATSPGWYN